MYQAGVKKITLYENKGISFRFFDAGNEYSITNLTNSGSKLIIENVQQPEFEIKLKFSDAGNVTQDFKVEFLLLGLTLENYEIVSRLTTSIYGWCFLVEFYDETQKFYNCPIYCKASEIKPHDEMCFKTTLETVVPTTRNYLEYTENVFLPYYRFDAELITWDSDIYTFDYEL